MYFNKILENEQKVRCYLRHRKLHLLQDLIQFDLRDTNCKRSHFCVSKTIQHFDFTSRMGFFLASASVRLRNNIGVPSVNASMSSVPVAHTYSR